jgi:hypothetical protein
MLSELLTTINTNPAGRTLIKVLQNVLRVLPRLAILLFVLNFKSWPLMWHSESISSSFFSLFARARVCVSKLIVRP